MRVNAGLNQTFTITPNVGFHVAVLNVDNVSVPNASSYTFSNVSADHMIVVAFESDAAGGPDTIAPSVPTGVTATAGSRRVTIAWQAATDNVGVVSYRLDLSRDSRFRTFVTGYNNRNVGNILSATATGLRSGVRYYARVRAVDAAGNISANSVRVSAVAR